MYTYEAFAQNCDDQGALLHPAIKKAGETQQSDLKETCEPSGIFSAIVQSALLLRNQPDIKLANKVLDEESFRLEEDITSKTLLNIINASRKRPPDQDNILALKASNLIVDACHEAEFYFAEVFDLMQGRTNNANAKQGYRLFYSPEGQPQIIQKLHFIPSALSLTPVSIDGVPYPAGSLLRVNTEEPLQSIAEYYCHMPVEAVTSAAFLRLSAFALEPADRTYHRYDKQQFYMPVPGQNPSESLTISEIKDIASVALMQHAEAYPYSG